MKARLVPNGWRQWVQRRVPIALVLLLCAASLPAQARVPDLDTQPFSRLGANAIQLGYQAPEPYYAQRLIEYQAQGYAPAPDVWIDLAGTDYTAQHKADLEERTGVGGREEAVLAWQEAEGDSWVE